MKRKPIIIALGVVAAAGISLFAAGCSEEESGVTYSAGDYIVDQYEYDGNTVYNIRYLLENNSYVTISGYNLTDMSISDAMGDITSFSLYEIEKNVTVDGQSISVSSIGEQAFYKNDTLKTVDLTKYNQSITFDIASSAFYGCTSLESVTLPSTSDVYAIGANSIGGSAFKECTSLKSIEITDVFSIVDSSAFAGCTSLESATLSANMTKISQSLFSGDTSLTTVTIPEDVTLTSIDNSAFYGCSSLESLSFTVATETDEEGTLTSTFSIGQYAFYGCEKLNDSIFDCLNGVTSIGQYAFAGCTSFTNVTLPESVDSASIGNYIFYNCSSIQSLTIKGSYSNTVYRLFGAGESETYEETSSARGSAFYVAYSNYAVPYSLTTVTLSNATTVAGYAFYGMQSLTNVSISFVEAEDITSYVYTTMRSITARTLQKFR